jgi:hypothetical protein
LVAAIAGALSLLAAPLIFCSGDLWKLLHFIQFNNLRIFKLFNCQAVLILMKKKKSFRAMSGAYGVNATMDRVVWLNISAQVGPGVLICCFEFTVHQTAIFVVCGELHCKDITGHLNTNVGLHFGLVECIDGAQCLCDQKR